jgi:hypothetical protein
MHTIVEAGNLTHEELELIRAAVANQGVLVVEVHADTHGRAVCAGRRKFFDPADGTVAQNYISKLGRLRQLELIRESGSRNRYELTNFGWNLSRQIAR